MLTESVSGSKSVYCWTHNYEIFQCEKFGVFIELQNANAIYSCEYFWEFCGNIYAVFRASFTAEPLEYIE